MIGNRAIHSLRGCILKENSATFSGTGGSLIITVCGEGVFHVDYSFTNEPVDDVFRKASLLQFDPSASQFRGARLIMKEETEGEYVLKQGQRTLSVRKADAVLTVFEDDIKIHGGVIGTPDTVLPRFPLRILGGRGRDTEVRFNFKLEDEDRFFGLGDKAGGLNKRGQRFQMFNRDALGYRASLSDPLYKSIPFLLKQVQATGKFAGIYFPAPVMGDIDLGRESNFFYSIEMKGGPFSYVVMAGDSAWEVLDSFTRLTGRPSLPPLYTFGFLGSSMNYTEPDDADNRVNGYFDKIEKHDIPCEGFYFSSGYIKADNGERYQFQWNKGKFPDPGASLRHYRERGYHIACNVKPGFLVNHPLYKELDKKGYFIKDQEGNSYQEYYWGNNASFIDLTNPKALAWWKQQLRDNLIDYGVSGIWNDNNELELEDQNLEAQAIRSQFPVLMSKASWEVYSEVNPGKRPWIISRSGGTGIQKYARTWTGDNMSNYESMKYNLLQGLTLGLSGIPYYGHDIGGFFGDHPDTKQFIRWCQSAVFQPRFVIHSWNEDGHPTELWSYTDEIEILRDLVRLHYVFMPYIYNTAIEASLTGKPMERPLALAFPEDRNLDPDSVHYMFGDDILVLSAVEEGEEIVTVSLPSTSRWIDSGTGDILDGGQTLTLEYPYRGIRYLVREGSLVVTAPGCSKLDTGLFSKLNFALTPSSNGVFTRTFTEDQGDAKWNKDSHNTWEFLVDSRRGIISISQTAQMAGPQPEDRIIRVKLPEGYFFTESGTVELSISCLPEKAEWNFKKASRRHSV